MKLNILIITTEQNSYPNRRLQEEAEKKGHNVKFIDPFDLVCVVSNQNGRDKAFNQLQRLFVKDIDVIIPRMASVSGLGSVIVRHLNENMHIPSTTKAEGIEICSNKMKTTQMLSLHKIPVPQTTIGTSIIDYDFLLEQVKGHPFIAKTLHGSQGSGVSIMETPLATKTALISYYKSKVNLLFQEYVDTKGKDVRAFVVDGEVVASMERSAIEGDFRSNISLGGKGKKINLSQDEESLAVRAAAACKSIGVCGVDMMYDEKKGTYRVIECNSNPNLKGIEEYTGVNVAKYIIEYAEKIGKKRIRENEDVKNATDEEKTLALDFLHSIIQSTDYKDKPLISHIQQRMEHFLLQNKKEYPNLSHLVKTEKIF